MLHPAKEWKHFAAMLLIGDGVMALVSPQYDAEAWAVGPLWWKKSMGFLRDCPILTRLIASAQIAGGIWWALSQEASDQARESESKPKSKNLRAA